MIADARDAFAALRATIPAARSITPSAILPMLAAVRAVRTIDGSLATETARLLGPLYDGPGTDWDHVETVLDGVGQIRDLFRSGAVPEAVVALMGDRTGRLRAEPGFGDISRVGARVRRDLGWLATFLRIEQLGPATGPAGSVDLVAIATFCDDRLTRLGDLDRWLERTRLRERATRLGIGGALEALREQQAPPALWADILRANLLLRWLSDIIEATPAIRRWSGEDHERRVASFRQADLAHIANTPGRVRHGITARYGRRRHLVSAAETALLNHELSRTSRRLSPLALISRLPNLFPAIAPCLMMSPLSVATYLPDDLEAFDLIVFDEASQVRPHDAIGAILRGRQVVVVGDDRQLPPTSFMEKAFAADDLDEDEDLDLLAGQESLLRALSATAFGPQGGLATFTLRWHYRSRDEQLIAFSNAHFYESALITLPAAARSDGPALVFDHCPDGRFVRRGDHGDAPRGGDHRPGTNAAEAARIVDHLRAHVARRPWRSLGVVTLNQPQADLVADLVERAATADSDLRAFLVAEGLDPFFVKALEQVQGDERDDIILGVGFSKEADERIRLYFGPIGQTGGERRLNVAITRARHRLVVVSSLLGGELRQRLDQGRGDIAVSTTRSLGYLADFLAYAQDGHLRAPATRDALQGSSGDPLPAAVAAFLRAQGHTVVDRVGTSSHALDLAVVDPADPARYLLGVDVDGSVAMRAPTARDRERIRPDHLAALGWRTHRVDALGWERAPQRERDLLLAAIAAATLTPR